jgi:DNA repair exonuclease SbcCD ATPase subunit
MNSLPSLPDLTEVRAKANKALGSRDALDEQIGENTTKIRELENEDELLDLVANLIRRLIDGEVTDGVKAVEKLQTEGLQEVFYDQDLSVRADVSESRGKVWVTLYTRRKLPDGTVVEGIADQSFGGSVLTMQSILMRATVIFRREMRPMLLLDETLAAVANKYLDRAAKFLSKLCQQLDLDILLISHDEALINAADHAYIVSDHGGKAKFRKLKKGKS